MKDKDKQLKAHNLDKNYACPKILVDMTEHEMISRLVDCCDEYIKYLIKVSKGNSELSEK